MRSFMEAFGAVYLRNGRLLRRQRGLIAQTFVLPAAILLLVAPIFGGGGDAWPVLLVDEAEDAVSARFTEVLENLESEITPYFNIRQLPLREAQALVDRGRFHMLIRIPEDFATSRVLHVRTHDVNSDATKNVRLRLDYALNVFERQQDIAGTVAVLEREHDQGVWRSAYMGGSAALLALFLGSLLVAANLFVFDLEHRTRTEIMGTPTNLAAAGLGIMTSAVTVAYLASLVPLVLSWVMFSLPFSPRPLLSVYTAIAPTLFACAGVGVLLGHLLRSYRAVQPIIILIAIITFFGGGGFIAVSMLQPAAQLFAEVWLPSRIFSWFNPLLHGFTASLPAAELASSFIASGVGVALMLGTYARERRQPPVQGI